MDRESKKMIMGFLSVIGSISLAFTIYNYIYPYNWGMAFTSSIVFLVIGAVSISLAIIIALSLKSETEQKSS